MTIVTLKYLLAAMAAWVQILAARWVGEEPAAQLVRRENIARAAWTVAHDPHEPALFGGPQGRAKTALFMLSIASFESGYHRRVDNGEKRGDKGNSSCLMQVWTPCRSCRTPDGWTGDDLVASHERCFRAGLHALAMSLERCAHLKGSDKFSLYTNGQCTTGAWAARHRVARAEAWLTEHPMP